MAYVVSNYEISGTYTGSGQVISKNIPNRDGAGALVVDIKVASGSGTAKLQDSSNGFTDSNTKAKTVAISGAGTYSITLLPHLAGDQANYPLRVALRVILDSATACVIEEVRVCNTK